MIKTGYQALVAAASAQVKTYSVAEVRARLQNGDVQLIDVREAGELKRDGAIAGAFHAPRGMLEFWIDPESPYFKPVFAQDEGQNKEFVFFCAAGWRSALAAKTAQDMGLRPVAHLDGGFGAWQAAGAPIQFLSERK
jgi:rhodanese-related sulfurtransferase